jgi:transposase
MRFVGMDVHKRETEVCILDQAGEVLQRERFATTRERLLRFAKQQLGSDARVALEATTNTWGVVDVLQPFCERVVPSNPMRTRAIAEARVKTDKIDAWVLAQLLRTDFLPAVWTPDEDTRLMRTMTTRRAVLVSDVTRLKNRLHAVLHQRLIPVPNDSLFSPAGRRWLAALELDSFGRSTLDSDLKLLSATEQELEHVTREIAQIAYRQDRVRVLMTLPGVHVTVASALLAALGEITRFKDGDHAASYLGLVPSTYQSADTCYHGPITKRGNSHARWLLVQAAQHLDKHPGPLGVFFRKLTKKKNRNVAVVATARKLVVIAYQMLRNNEPYRYALPRSTQEKLAALRRAAGTKRSRRGPGKGTKRPAGYGSGIRTHAIPSLAQIYQAEDVPAPKPLSTGERRMLAETETIRFAESLHNSHREPRTKRDRAKAEQLRGEIS